MFYHGEIGKSINDLAKSVFVEKLNARGYEVLLVNEGLDEALFQRLQMWKSVFYLFFLLISHLLPLRKIPFQDVAKAGLKFGDEGDTYS